MRPNSSHLKQWRAILLVLSNVSKAEGLLTTMIPSSIMKPVNKKQSIRMVSMTLVKASPIFLEDKTALDYFDDMQDDRIDRADQIRIDLSVFEDFSKESSDEMTSDDPLETGRSELGTDISTKSNPLPPIIELEYLKELYSSVESSHAMKYAEERLQFFQQVQSRGGCCLVKFNSDSRYTSILKDMWSSMEEFYDNFDDAGTNEANVGTGSNDQSSKTKTEGDSSPSEEEPLLMRQHLARPEQSPNAGGYDFVQTYWDPKTKSVVPTTIQDSLGWDHPVVGAVEDSFHALSDLSKMFTIVLSSGGLQRPIQEMESLLNEAILDDFGCCNHRLCQYRPLIGASSSSSNRDIATKTESLLRSHTDWSLVTCIPVSPTPGLLIFDPLYQKWLAPDTVAASPQVGDMTHKDENERSHSQYCLMMTGKSMDMLIGVDGGMACIHQVVPVLKQQQQQQAPKQRLSAPFFFRPKESVSKQINELCNSQHCPSEKLALNMLHEVYCKLGT
mmetsp:Transcript_2023/g.4563  ORF Transcript_2023/g.4563 Transcript_2023/m.4563 type:complete len:502 (+) Transcript_2023:55-1560(+)